MRRREAAVVVRLSTELGGVRDRPTGAVTPCLDLDSSVLTLQPDGRGTLGRAGRAPYRRTLAPQPGTGAERREGQVEVERVTRLEPTVGIRGRHSRQIS